MKQYSLFLEGLGDPYFNKRLGYGTLEELNNVIYQYFKDDLITSLSSNDDIRSTLELLENEADPNIYAGILKYGLDWFITVGTFVLYDDEGTKIDPVGLDY